ncbi:MAG: valine--tRNA ligase [Candidatus Margulisbacteria bacterium]|nr:valine--tRNA ligase [Candidatus Margulisiibacteriota bacterium]
MSEELAKVYNPAEVEQKWYAFWEGTGLFKPAAGTKGLGAGKTFTIVIPPPNVTGSLHMGHALNNSIQDLLIRYKRMNGFETLWVPGTDHAGIATQNVVERELKKEGKKKEDLGREKFVEKVWEWKKEYGGRITRQLRRLGASCDWSRERFTMDEGLSLAVRRHFVQLYNEGLIYRGKRIINWCPRCKTALSDIEVEHENKNGFLWHLKYPVEGSKEFVVVATTRPETMLGDTAVAVNPRDERYKRLAGKNLILPLVGRHIPIIKDEFVDQAFGTGAVKVTPAHDPNDYEMGMRHNLPFINVLTPDGLITLGEFGSDKERQGVAGIEGLERGKARDAIVKLLEEQGFLAKIEDYQNSVGHCYRCKTVIEPYLSDQWFVKVKPLAEKAIAAVEEGQIKYIPERWTKVYLQWMTNLRDWCISRQLWWGHQVPAWYCGGMTNDPPKADQMTNGCCEIVVAEEKPEKCPKCGGTNMVQDPDVFDTWFSSALWPFSTLGWPNQTENLKKHYPTDVLVTSYDIISFWVSRMIMAGVHLMKKEPFHTVYIHGLVKDIHGKKMSKSWGNVIDPLEVIDRAGADALRFAFISLIAGQGQDVKLSEEKITEARNFANKIWNVSRFVLMTRDQGPKARDQEPGARELADRWILSRYNSTIEKVSASIDSFEFGEAAKTLYDFIWSEFCDWYVELAKIRLYGDDSNAKAAVQAVLMTVLEGTMKILHPFMPFITEETYQRLKGRTVVNPEESLMVQPWPQADREEIDPNAEEAMAFTMEVIRAIRNIRADFNVSHGSDVEVVIVTGQKPVEAYIKALAKVNRLTIVAKLDAKPPQSASATITGASLYVPLGGFIDPNKEIARLTKEKEKLSAEIIKITERLGNANFVARANPEAVQKEKERQIEYSEKVKTLAERIKDLG